MRKLFLCLSLLALLAVKPVAAKDLVQAAETSATFKVFLAALQTAGFDQTLKNSGPFTVFAPTDEAFGKLPEGTWEAITNDKVKLSSVLAYHVIPGKVLVAEVKPGKTKTVEGREIMLKSDNGKITVNDANVTESDIEADNGVIHAIDKVLLPPQ